MIGTSHETIRLGTTLGSKRGERPLVSLIVPNYNKAEHLPILIESVRRQTRDFPLEIILVDDRSTDSSIDVVAAESDVNILRLRRNSGNDALPVNTGISRARGKYIAIVDADDYLLADDGLLQCVRALESKPQASAAVTNVVFQFEMAALPPAIAWMGPGGPGGIHALQDRPKQLEYGDRVSSLTRRNAQDWSIFDLMVYMYHTGLRVVRTDVAREVQGYSTTAGSIGDSALSLRLAALRHKDPAREIIPIDVDGYAYRIHGVNDSLEADEQTAGWRQEVIATIQDLGLSWEELAAASVEQAAKGLDALLPHWGFEPADLAQQQPARSTLNLGW